MPIPYKIVFDNENVARFTTKNKVEYKALFSGRPLPGLPEIEGFIFDFSFQRDTTNCTNLKHPGYDARIRATLEKLMNRFFELEPCNVMSFVCESTDNKHQMRQRVFANWHTPHRATIAKNSFCLPSGIIESDGKSGEVVGGLFYVKDHPLASVIEAGLVAEVAFYSMIKADY